MTTDPEQLRTELTQMQLDANTICQSLGIKWARDGNYPEFAIRAIEKLRGKWARKEWERDEIQAELTKTRSELKDLQGANREYGRQLADVTDNREFWYEKAQDAEAEAKQSQADLKLNAKMLADQCDQAREAENERDAWRRKAREWGRDTWSRKVIETLRQQLKEVKAERLATLDAAKAALADCGIGGIYAEFDGLADAINQMAQHIKELSSRLTQAQADLDAEPIEVEITGKEMAQALQAEQRLRQGAEQRAERLYGEYTGMHEALDECNISRDYGDGSTAAGRTRVFWLNQCAEYAEAQLSNGHGALAAAGILRSDASGKLSICGRVMRLRQRTERAEALAQLVTKETAGLLERLAEGAQMWNMEMSSDDIKQARDLAAQIREALDK